MACLAYTGPEPQCKYARRMQVTNSRPSQYLGASHALSRQTPEQSTGHATPSNPATSRLQVYQVMHFQVQHLPANQLYSRWSSLLNNQTHTFTKLTSDTCSIRICRPAYKRRTRLSSIPQWHGSGPHRPTKEHRFDSCAHLVTTIKCSNAMTAEELTVNLPWTSAPQ